MLNKSKIVAPIYFTFFKTLKKAFAYFIISE